MTILCGHVLLASTMRHTHQTTGSRSKIVHCTRFSVATTEPTSPVSEGQAVPRCVRERDHQSEIVTDWVKFVA